MKDMINLSINPDLIAQQMGDDLDNAKVYLVAYRHEPEVVKATNILKLAAGVRAVCQMLIESMRNDVKANPHQIERFAEIQVEANRVIESFNSSVVVQPFVRQNGASAGKEAVVLGEAPPTQRKVRYTGKNGLNGKSEFVPYKHLSPAQRSTRRTLNDDHIRAIRKHFEGRTGHWPEYEEIATMYDTTAKAVWNVIKRKTFDWVK